MDLSRLDLKPHKLFHHLDEVVKWQNGEDFAPVFVELSPIDVCNQQCHFCYTEYLGHKKYLEIERDLLIRIFREMGGAGVKSVLVQGTGEPLANRATPDAIVEGKKAGSDIALGTNGVLFTEKTLEQAVWALSWLRVSAIECNAELYAKSHGCPESHFDRVIRNLRKAVEIRNRDGIECVISVHFLPFEYNAPYVLETVKMVKDIGLDYFLIKKPQMGLHNPNHQWPRDLHKKYRELLEECAKLEEDGFIVSTRWDQFERTEAPGAFKKNYGACYGMLFETMVDADAKVYPCLNHWRDAKYCIGDLREQSFGEIWFGERRKQVLEDHWKNYDLKYCHFECKQHHINETLWNLANPPMHVNFL